MKLEINGYTLVNLTKINILFGKNGCGKSTALRLLAQKFPENNKEQNIRYIIPERGGILKYQPGISDAMGNDPNYLFNQRSGNQSAQFRAESVSLFKELESIISRRNEKHDEETTEKEIGTDKLKKRGFRQYINKINDLLENIEIKLQETSSSFEIFSKNDGIKIDSSRISSGESELICLAIECLTFSAAATESNQNILLLDEPDVHLHPDLQAGLMRFLQKLVEENNNLNIIIATHSTAILGALENYHSVSFEFMKKEQKIFDFKKVESEYKEIIPIFGAHPLSSIYSLSTPIFLVEGINDEWIWQQAIRTSKGKIKFFICDVDGEGNMRSYEDKTNAIINALYDNNKTKAYSLRDRDDRDPDIKDLNIPELPNLKRFLLTCRSAENLFLSEDVLIKLGTSFEKLKVQIDAWLENVTTNSTHQAYTIMKEFKEKGYDRKYFGLKEILNILVGFVTQKPWQVIVGQCIGELIKKNDLPNISENSIFNYLGAVLTEHLISQNKSSKI